MLSSRIRRISPLSIYRRHLSTASKRDDDDDEITHFGFDSVKASEKASKVGEVFHKVADRYDLMNDLMSGTLHRLWKDEFVNMLHPSPNFPLDIIDVAGGTGDIAFRMKKRMANKGHVTVCDINPSMLKVGEKRAQDKGYIDGLTWLEGDAEVLNGIVDSSKDAYTIAFGIRNVTHIDRAIATAHRVLKPGGRFMVLEFSQVESPLFQAIYDQYSMNVIPLLGEIIANDRHSYQYLVESIRKFPNQNKFKSMIEEGGFKEVTYTNFTGGIVAVHSGFKL